MGAFSVFFLRLILSILLALLIGRVFFRGDSIVKVIALAGVMLVLAYLFEYTQKRGKGGQNGT
ncbi:MAG: hypothetical protein JRF46_08575 [Deltaproteobacteria bacterium]|nr:hypothetical protein [Deltaproteobacteria bacterium]